MRAVATVLSLVLLAGCAKEETAETPPPAATTLADFAGNWQVSTVLPGTANPVSSTMNSSADGTTWTMSLEGRPSVPLTVEVVGDSMIAQSAEYESVLRPGVMVRVRTATAMNAGALSGTITATYRASGGDEVVNGTFTGNRIL